MNNVCLTQATLHVVTYDAICPKNCGYHSSYLISFIFTAVLNNYERASKTQRSSIKKILTVFRILKVVSKNIFLIIAVL